MMPLPGSRRGAVALLALTAALSLGCSVQQQQTSLAGTYEGAPVAIGEGQAWTFVTLDDQGNPGTLGIRLSEKALSGLPAEPPVSGGEWEYQLALPREAAGSGYDHVTVDWNPHGHIPEGVYNVPHFDFHFYVIDADTRNAITAVGDDLERSHKQPEASYMPAGYVLPPGTEVPRMGAHAIDPAGDEFQNRPFTQTFIYGFYDGSIIFMEPMITLSFLQSRPSVSTPIKQPAAYLGGFAYPNRYGVRYDSAAKQYEITLNDLARH
ncbi:hypothetical protein GCM10011348_08550 [Marinobacterium nitratireducens]|uniref:TTHB210-like domain-containing protein n=1 Tax=Marinobacterium nitratireducens TaxID=518897 RepID=A0A918DQ31_9GAMM|nr:DUF5602 domain-containing protein [Marinobacterium nitratireducens]GGO77911.1 hypothetical protein GCM10011348_08550 [Marinobacterium nitratireducens]